MEDREERRGGWGGRRRRDQSYEEGDEVGLGLGGECVEPSLPPSAGFVGRHDVGWSKQRVCVLAKSGVAPRFDKRKTKVGCQNYFLSQVKIGSSYAIF